ncbi:putative iron-sulfur-binding oxidoreductase FadF [subsurface metagenome]
MEIKNEIARCTECEVCLETCPTYQVTGELLFSPLHRLKTAAQIFNGVHPDPSAIESIYNCPKCLQCETVCPEELKITEVIHETREELVRQGFGPLERHNEIIQGILDTGNSVNGDPEKRLEWLPEEYIRKESDTLLYMGCLPSYLIKEAATSTYLTLKKLGIDFMILEDEGCCGTYIYEAGRRDIAVEFFQKNVERFKSLGIKHIVVPCNGCLKCFKYFYPKVLGSVDFTVHHALEAIYDKLKEKPQILRKIPRTATYQDSCRLSRGERMTEEPRELLNLCGLAIEEPENNRENTPCCGAGAGIRSVYRDLSMQIASNLLTMAPSDSLVSACPFCVFNLNYTSRRKELGKKAVYFTSLVLESLE